MFVYSSSECVHSYEEANWSWSCLQSGIAGCQSADKTLEKNNYWLLIHTDWLPSLTELDVSGVFCAVCNWMGINEAERYGKKYLKMSLTMHIKIELTMKGWKNGKYEQKLPVAL